MAMAPSPRPGRRPSSSSTPAAARGQRRGGPRPRAPRAPSLPSASREPPSPDPRQRPAPASATTIDDLGDDTIEEILVRLPSAASLTRATRWGGPRPRAPAPGAPRAPSPPPAPRGASSADAPAAADTTIDKVPDGIIEEILIRLPSSASLKRARRVCSRWSGIASNPGFRQRFRKRHPVSPLIGIFSNEDHKELVSRPTINLVDHGDSDITDVIKDGDFFLTDLKCASGARWRIRDSRNGVLLLCRDGDNSWCVHNPASRRQPVSIQDCPDDVAMDGEFVSHCLLHGRVVSVQVNQRRQEVRAVVYDSTTSEWCCHPWAGLPSEGGVLSIHPKWGMPMYAAGRIFWVHGPASLYVLDTCTMEFLACPFPKKWQNPGNEYSIGEINDGEHTLSCLVCLRGLSAENYFPRLQVWSLRADDNNMLELDLKKEVPMSQLEIPANLSSRVYTVINGLAVITYHRGPHFVVDLQKETVLYTLQFGGQRGYLYQLSWPAAPAAINSGSTPPLQDNNIDDPLPTSEGNIRSSHDLVESAHVESDSDERRKLSPGNEINEPSMLSCLDNTCSGSQYMDPPDVDEGSGNVAAPCENHHTDKSTDNLCEDGEPRERKRWKTNATSNVCLGETTMGCQDQYMPSLNSCDPIVVESETVPRPKGGRRTRLSHAVHDISSVEAEISQSNLGATSRNSSMGCQATQDKPLCTEKSGVHVEVGTETEKMNKCHFKGCTLKFSNRSNLNKHVREIHVQGKCISCGSCDMMFRRPEHLEKHVESKHKRRSEPLVCRGCTVEFATKHERGIHEKSAEHFKLDAQRGAKRFKCCIDGCEARFSHLKGCNRHYKNFHLKTSASCGESGRPGGQSVSSSQGRP